MPGKKGTAEISMGSNNYYCEDGSAEEDGLLFIYPGTQRDDGESSERRKASYDTCIAVRYFTYIIFNAEIS